MQGILSEVEEDALVLDIQGIGYRIFITQTDKHALPPKKEQVRVYTSFIVRENSHALYGFLSCENRDLFEVVITLSGIGPRTGLNLLSQFNSAQLQRVIGANDSLSLARVPGIGKKTAERLLIDLRNKLKFRTIPLASQKMQDALQALLNLGFTYAAAEKALAHASKELSSEYDLSELITAALKHKEK